MCQDQCESELSMNLKMVRLKVSANVNMSVKVVKFQLFSMKTKKSVNLKMGS